MDAFFEQTSAKLGGNPTADQLRIVASILSSYPCALLFKFIPSNQILLKHLYSICITSYIMVSVLHYHYALIHVVAACMFTYLFMKYCKSKKAPWINFIVIMLSMSYCHYTRLANTHNFDNIKDYSGILMLVTIKLTSYGFNVEDGRTQDQHLLSSYNKRMKIDRYPTLIEFFGWIFFFGGFLVGPTSEFMDYMRFATLKMFETKDGKVLVPLGVKPTMLNMLKSICFIGVIVFMSPYCNAGAVDSAHFRQLSYFNKIVYLNVAAFVARCKYYVAWLLSEGACILCGFGFNGFSANGTPLWNRFTNIVITKCEFAQSVKEMVDHWNIGTNRWLRYYVYERVTPRGQTGGAFSASVVYIVSAVWHGFYPGYYLFFLSVTPFQMLARKIRRCFRPLFLVPGTKEPTRYKVYYDCAGIIVTMTIINILSAAFNLLYWAPAIRAWKEIYYTHYILLVLGQLLLNFTSQSARKYQKAREAKAVAKATPAAEKVMQQDQADLSTPSLESTKPLAKVHL
ncbi:MBOAT, membrane-bound O-acyltransferase family-domain-containing protein [Mycotypha africana]|uniref:MBOAT, membrane-bound O-acyltransferase family-domain-containing protein n=1 Tax=Mycotypha africana TaxID=64632 RepID=UPI002301B681|nr:MBOAT, membrane-bound O-acyltransferase family-domain-containing protein [Mycotypha africana]KAI8977287.1 MBOAT, membrane-bound O-acyltransferase family-domain-containing protein [Mycotypha africana]